MCINAETSNKIKTLKRPLDLPSWMSRKTRAKALAKACWEHKPGRNGQVGEKVVAMQTVNNPLSLEERRQGVKGTENPRKACF